MAIQFEALSNKFTIAIQSKEGLSYHRDLSSSDIHEELRRIGLEWKTADWAHDQEVLIVVAPQKEIEWIEP